MNLFHKLLAAVYLALVPRIGHGISLRAHSHHQSTNSQENSTSNAKSLTNSSEETFRFVRAARVHFLFLAVDGINNFAVWRRFFAKAPAFQYRAFVHCKTLSCTIMAGREALLSVVPEVPSSYCRDLVSPMNQLLQTALMDDPGPGNPADKFVFISDSTLPAKPFSQIYSTLTNRVGSDFCVFPSNEWADVPRWGKGGVKLAIKTHQWSVLNRNHAKTSVDLWGRGALRNLAQEFELNKHKADWQNSSFGDSRNSGCLDEFWHFSALFGVLANDNVNEQGDLPCKGLTNGPLRISANAGWQGACDTFALWSDYADAPMLDAGKDAVGRNPFMKLLHSLDAISEPHGSSHRPGWWDMISRDGVQAIRDSEFLFIRKFIDKPTMIGGSSFNDEYSKIVLTTNSWRRLSH